MEARLANELGSLNDELADYKRRVHFFYLIKFLNFISTSSKQVFEMCYFHLFYRR